MRGGSTHNKSEGKNHTRIGQDIEESTNTTYVNFSTEEETSVHLPTETGTLHLPTETGTLLQLSQSSLSTKKGKEVSYKDL